MILEYHLSDSDAPRHGTSAGYGGNDDEDWGALQQESFFTGSSILAGRHVKNARKDDGGCLTTVVAFLIIVLISIVLYCVVHTTPNIF